MIYDIHTEQAAQATLCRMTGISMDLWESNIHREREYKLQDFFVEAMIQEYATQSLPLSYKDFDFVYFHITTSSDGCQSIQKNGILDLRESYKCRDSELRRFLDEHGVNINLDYAILSYCGHQYDITFRGTPWDTHSEQYKRWSVGRKFYYDYATCGFLSVWQGNPYGGWVHKRPEILMDIDALLGTCLSEEWEQMHKPYAVLAKVSGKDICYFSDDDESEREKVMAYTVMAYNAALNAVHEEIILLKNGVQIPPENILEIKPFTIWA